MLWLIWLIYCYHLRFCYLYKYSNLNHILGSFLIGIFPITIFLGSAIINFYIVLIDLILVYEIIRNKNYNYFNDKIFYFLSLIWISLFVNLIFSQDPQNSFGRTFGFLRFILLVFAIKYYLIDDITQAELIAQFSLPRKAPQYEKIYNLLRQ